MAKESSERRAKRAPVNLKIKLQLVDRAAFVEEFSDNISRSGLFMRTDEPSPVGSRVKFEYRLADNTRLMRGMGVVRWRRTPEKATDVEPAGMGIEFVDIDAQTDELITKIVAEHGEGSLAPKRKRVKIQPVSAASTKAEPIDDSKLDAEDTGALDAFFGEDDSAVEVPEPQSTASRQLAPANDSDIKPHPMPSAAKAAAPATDGDTKPHPMPQSKARSAPVEEDGDTKPRSMPQPTADQATASPTADWGEPVLWIDMCGSELLGAQAPDGSLRQKTNTLFKFGVTHGGLHLDEKGAFVPHIMSWLGGRWPSPGASAVARRVGVKLVKTAKGEPAIKIGKTPVPLVLALRSSVASSCKRHGGKEKITGVCVVIPANASASSRKMLAHALGKMGLSKFHFTEDALAVASAAGLQATQDSPVLTIQVGHYECRVALVCGPAKLSGRSVLGTGIADGDELLREHFSTLLLRNHGVDVEKDKRLGLELRAQLRQAKPSGDTVTVKVGDNEVSQSLAELAARLAPVTERVVLLCDSVLQDQNVDSSDLQASVLVADGDLWPGFVKALSTQLGLEPRVLPGGAWARLSGATQLGRS